MGYVGFERVRTYHGKETVERICRKCNRPQPLEDFCENRTNGLVRARTWECHTCRSKRRRRAVEVGRKAAVGPMHGAASEDPGSPARGAALDPGDGANA